MVHVGLWPGLDGLGCHMSGTHPGWIGPLSSQGGWPGLLHMPMEGPPAAKEEQAPVGKHFSRLLYHVWFWPHWPKLVMRPSQIQGMENRLHFLTGVSIKILWPFFFIFPPLLGILLAEVPQLSALSETAPFFPKKTISLKDDARSQGQQPAVVTGCCGNTKL